MTAGPTASSVLRPSGLVLSPFRALRYDPATAGELSTLTSPPYDVIDADGVAALEQASEHNVVRLILPREDVAAGQDRYAHAAGLLDAWRQAGVLVPDDVPALYVYEQAAPDVDGLPGHVQRGLLGALALTPAEDGIVLPHENTMAGPVSDRLALYTAVEADLEPIFLVYDGGGAASRAVASVDRPVPSPQVDPPAADTARAADTPPVQTARGDVPGSDTPGTAPSNDTPGAETPTTVTLLVDAVLADGLRHRLWALTDAEVLAAVAADLLPRKALIADGHHRYATYLQRQSDRHAAGDGAGPWDAGLCLLVDATAFGPEVHPIHRVVPGVPVEVLARQAAAGAVVRRLDTEGADGAESPAATPAPTPGPDGITTPTSTTSTTATAKEDPADRLAGALAVLAATNGPAFLLASGDGAELHLVSDPDREQLAAAVPTGHSAAWAALDVSVLHAYLVGALWGLPDDVEHVSYEHDVASALAAATRTGGTAVLLKPTPVEAVAAVAGTGERMPRKSTLFTPKPATGLVVRAHRDA